MKQSYLIIVVKFIEGEDENPSTAYYFMNLTDREKEAVEEKIVAKIDGTQVHFVEALPRSPQTYVASMNELVETLAGQLGSDDEDMDDDEDEEDEDEDDYDNDGYDDDEEDDTDDYDD